MNEEYKDNVKGCFEQILGKRITGVIARANSAPPRGQIFLIFDDDTFYEFYSGSTDKIYGTQGISIQKGDIDHVRNLECRYGNICFEQSIDDP